MQPDTLLFGQFELFLSQRTLTEHGAPVKLGARALDILCVLLENPGELVTRTELLARVWPDTIVDENALRVHMSALRKALGDQQESLLIRNEPGRGYRFVGKVLNRASAAQQETTDQAISRRGRSLPHNLNRMIGRDDVVSALADLLEERHFLSIVGPGGIGKTTVALAVGQSFQAQGRARPYFIDLAPLLEPELVQTALAAQLGVAASATNVENAIIDALQREKTLLVFDNCEHLVDAVASTVEDILHLVSDVLVLTTSREPLRAEAEWVYRLETLDKPEMRAQLSVQEALAFPAIQLFCERAAATLHGFDIQEADVEAVIEICNKLDGIPLAIEMAAARIDILSATDIASKLDDRLSLLTRGRRTALPRQQTLRATLDWSFDFLSDRDRDIFQRLSVFRSSFRLDGAVAVCAPHGETEVLEALNALVAKSLVTMDRRERTNLYRLLDTTRFYGADKLMASDSAVAAWQQHTEYCLRFFSEQQKIWDGHDPLQNFVEVSWRVDDLRAAFDWTFSPEGNVAMGLELVVASAPLWFHLSLPNEYLSVLRRAIRAINGSALVGTVLELEVLSAYGHALWHTYGPNQEMKDAFVRGLAIARQRQLDSHILRTLWGLWARSILAGNYAESLMLAEEKKTLAYASGELANYITADHGTALSNHFLGRQEQALEMVNAVLAGDRDPGRVNHRNHAQVDGRVAAQSLKMRILWMQGEFEDARALAKETADLVRVLDHDLSTCYGLAIGCIPVAFWAGERELARDWTRLLTGTTAKRGLRHWEVWAEGFSVALGDRRSLPDDFTAMQGEVFATIGVKLDESWLRCRLEAEPETWCSHELARQLALVELDLSGDASSFWQRIVDLYAMAGEGNHPYWMLRLAVSAASQNSPQSQPETARTMLTQALAAVDGSGAPENGVAREILEQFSSSGVRLRGR